MPVVPSRQTACRRAIRPAEQTLGLHPRRRTALVQARLTALLATVAERQQAQQERLSAELAQLETDNVDVTSPLTVVTGLDAGFATDANLTGLIGMGYTVLTKARIVAIPPPACSVATRRRRLGRGWGRMPRRWRWESSGLGNGHDGLEALQVRYHLPEGWRPTTLLDYGDLTPPAPADWFSQYNGHQVVEAGIKENKGVFTMHRPLLRSPIGMQIQAQFALFAANFVRWAAAWAREQLREVPVALAQVLTEVKTLVRVLAHSRARLVETSLGVRWCLMSVVRSLALS
jgi:hypothetical protein